MKWYNASFYSFTLMASLLSIAFIVADNRGMAAIFIIVAGATLFLALMMD